MACEVRVFMSRMRFALGRLASLISNFAILGTRDANAYRAKLERMTDERLVREVSDKVWLAAAEEDARSGKAIGQGAAMQRDATRQECLLRGKPWLFQQGWNAAVLDAGYELADTDLALADPGHESYRLLSKDTAQPDS